MERRDRRELNVHLIGASWPRRLGRGVMAMAACAALTAAAGCDDGGDPIVSAEQHTEPGALPPPIAGGTLTLSPDGATAYVSDASTDSVVVVDIAARTVVREVPLEPGDEPGRVVVGDDAVYVSLRRGGGVAAIDPTTGEVTRRQVCAAPRGLAFDAARAELHVACVDGALVTLDAGDLDAPATRTVQLSRDLRDVVVDGDHLVVTRLKSAEAIVVELDGAVRERHGVPDYHQPLGKTYRPAVAWAAKPIPGGGVAIVHQRHQLDAVGGAGTSSMQYYGATCDQAILHSAVTVIDADGGAPPPGVGGLGTMVLPVDIALSADGSRFAVAAAGSEIVVERPTQSARTSDLIDNCSPGDTVVTPVLGEPVGVAYQPGGTLVVQTRQPATLQLLEGANVVAKIVLPARQQRHPGHALFHRAPTAFSGVACASCHPEGREDGHTWLFDSLGPRRTQFLGGGIMATAPLHWAGDMNDMDHLMSEVFVGRMGGAEQPPERVAEFATWIDGLPTLPKAAPEDPAAVARGEAIYWDSTVGCGSCHSGPQLTNNATVDVGTGEALQVPTLLDVADRAPFMHDGCAATLRDRFDPSCGGGDAHGVTSHLGDGEIDDLIAYLETL